MEYIFNKEQPLSIIIPHHNTSETMGRLLKSIVESDLSVKVYVIDDYSDEYHRNIVKELCNKYEFVNFIENNSAARGAGAARNIGLGYCDTRWVMFADADDYLISGWDSAVKQFLDSENDIVYFCPKGARGFYYEQLVREYLESDKKSNCLRFYYVPPWGKIFSTIFLKENNIFFDEIMYSNDVMFSIKSGVKARKIDACDKSIYYIDEIPNSLTKQISEDVFMSRAVVAIERILYMKKTLSVKEFKENQCGAYMQFLTAYKRYGIESSMKLYRLYKECNAPFHPSMRYILMAFRRHIKRCLYVKKKSITELK